VAKQVFTVAFASGTSTSSGMDLGDAPFTRMYAYVATATTGAAITVYGSNDGTTFAPLYERVNTAPVQHQTITIATATSGGWTALEAFPHRYVQFVASATFTNGTSVKVVAH
jgi:hypothetical protein